ncbi:MAG TPA: hypothetical protein VM867_04720, partial [Xanthobacteraceae bacterium]|nr:hypothetical protein [Xanthobacteraceae bacterium]
TWPLLAQLCRHVCQSRWVGQCLQEVRAGIAPTEDDELERIERLQRMHDREGKAVVALMVKLRITSQQRIPEDRDARHARAEAAQMPPPETAPWTRPSITQ